MSTEAAHKSWWQIGEVIFGIPCLVAIALQWLVPFSFPGGLLAPARPLAGAVLIILGMVLIMLARREFALHNQPTDPGHATTNLVISGVFSVSRNPIYLGATGFLCGIALAFDLPWVMVLLLPALAACHFVLIAPEERYLEARFGEKYRTYSANVHRWIGRSRQVG